MATVELVQKLCAESPVFLVKPAPYEEVEPFSGGLAAVMLKGKWGYVDQAGNMVIPAIYEEADWFIDGIASVVLDGKAVRIDIEGNPVLEPDYGDIDVDGDEDGDGDGDEVIAPIYDELEEFDGGYAVARLGDEWGLINKKGLTVIPFSNRKLIQHQGLVAFMQDDTWGLMDLSGKVSLEPGRYSRVYLYDRNRIWVKERDSENGAYGKKGVIAADGAEMIPVQYDVLHVETDDMSEDGLIGAGIGGKQGFIDRLGNVKIPFIYEEIYAFENGYAGVKLDGKYGVIDERGSVIIPFEYDEVYYTGKALFAVGKGCGKDWELLLLDENGQNVLPVRCEGFKNSEGLAWVRTIEGRLWGAVAVPNCEL